MAASPAPEGRRVLAPYLAVDDAAEAIDFYQRAFVPFGHAWHLATQVEVVPPEELAERNKAAMAAMGG